MLRALTEADLAAVHTLLSDWAVVRYMLLPHCTTIEESRNCLAELIVETAGGAWTSVVRTIETLDSPGFTWAMRDRNLSPRMADVCDTASMLRIRSAEPVDEDAIWAILEPVIRGGETYTLPREISRADAIAYWFAGSHEVFVAESGGQIIGTYFLRPNQLGGGSHVANCGYMTAVPASGKGVASAMCSHSLAHAGKRGFRAMQFNFVVSTNDKAVRLWQRFNFEIVGRLPGAFLHPLHGYVDAYVMYRRL